MSSLEYSDRLAIMMRERQRGSQQSQPVGVVRVLGRNLGEELDGYGIVAPFTGGDRS